MYTSTRQSECKCGTELCWKLSQSANRVKIFLFYLFVSVAVSNEWGKRNVMYNLISVIGKKP